MKKREKSTRLLHNAMNEKHKEILGREPQKGDLVTTAFIANQMAKYGDMWVFSSDEAYQEYKRALSEEIEAEGAELEKRLAQGWCGEPYDIIAFKHEGNGGNFFSIGFRVDNERCAWFDYVLGSHGDENRMWTTDQWDLGDVAEQRFATKEEVKRFINGCEDFQQSIRKDGDKWKISEVEYNQVREFDFMLQTYRHNNIKKHMEAAELWKKEEDLLF